MLVLDLHLDLAMSALRENRDLTLPIEACRQAEAHLEGKSRGHNTVTFPEMRRGHVGLCLATVLGRVQYGEGFGTSWRTHELAYAEAQGMLAYYRQLERMGVCRMLATAAEFAGAAERWRAAIEADEGRKTRDEGRAVEEATGAADDSHPQPWAAQGDGASASSTAIGQDSEPPFGLVLATEGCDCIVSPSQLPLWWEDGLRVISLVHYGVSKYAHGTGTEGPLSAEGRDLLRAMDEVGAILDVTHQCDTSFWESLDGFRGPVIASHQNCRALVPGGRQMSDDQLKALIDRGAIIGPALDNWMLYPGYVRGQTPNAVVSLEDYVRHIDHICQLAGNARHAAIGSDLDGGYGYEQTPRDLNTIADLQKVPGLLRGRGYSDADIAAIMGGNAIRFFSEALPRA